MLNPTIKSGCPLKRCETRAMTPGVSILYEITLIKRTGTFTLSTGRGNQNLRRAKNKMSLWLLIVG